MVKTDLYETLDASILIIDIRNFTPNLKDSEASASTHRMFCQFLAHFYQTCAQSCAAACDPKEERPLYLNSTGDGILAVFLSKKRHYVDAYLAGLMLFNKLPALFKQYNRRKHKRVSNVAFGIGIDTGSVWHITSMDDKSSPSIETYIGDCINIAARVESVTKDHDRTNLIISEHTYRFLCQQMFGLDYQQLMRKATDHRLTGQTKKRIWSQMNKLDEKLLLRFISAYNLRGVSEPVRLYRLSPTLAAPSRKECRHMLKLLTKNAVHLQTVLHYMTH